MSSLKAVRKMRSAPAAAAGATSGRTIAARRRGEPRAGDLRGFLQRAIELMVAVHDWAQAEHEKARQVAEENDPDGVVEGKPDDGQRPQEQQDRRDRENHAGYRVRHLGNDVHEAQQPGAAPHEEIGERHCDCDDHDRGRGRQADAVSESTPRGHMLDEHEAIVLQCRARRVERHTHGGNERASAAAP